MNKAQEQIKKQQQVWAHKRNIPFNRKGYVLNLTDNLFEPMQSDAEAEYRSGAGGELEGKIRALHSSSALVCNFFHYWRYHDVAIISEALGLCSDYTNLTFEKTYPKPVGIVGVLPHVDVELTARTMKPVAIESKFMEQYNGKQKTLKKVYVEKKGIWGHFSGCESLANQIVNHKEIFEYLDAPQLLKHILGLKTRYGEQNFELLYLWYRVDGEETDKHDDEIRRFMRYIGEDLAFRTMTHQEVFKNIRPLDTGHSNYFDYMKDRYF